MGMDWESLHARNPRLILVRITGFGQDGPLAQHPCFDGAAQAISGLMSMTGQHDGPPTMSGVFVCDYTTALYATIAALAAVRARDETGVGQVRSEEHTSELQSLMRISYAVFCLKKK